MYNLATSHVGEFTQGRDMIPLIPIIPIVAASTAAYILVKKGLKANETKTRNRILQRVLRDRNIPIDNAGNYNPNLILFGGEPLLFEFITLAPDLLETVMSDGANPNIRNAEGVPAVVFATKQQTCDATIPILLKYGADPNAMDPDGRTAIFYAKSVSTINHLWRAGADINATDCNGQTALFTASGQDIIFQLAQYHINIEARDNDGKTAVFYAKTEKEFKAFREWKADFNAKDNKGRTVLTYALSNFPSTTISVIIEAMTDINSRDVDGKTALFYASNIWEIHLLKRAKADFNIQDNTGKTVLFDAISELSEYEIREIIDSIANINIRDMDGKTTLFYASQDWQFKLLKEYGADFSIQDNTGKTILFYAITKNLSPLTIQTIIKLGADVNARDNEGKTALFYAVSQDISPLTVRKLLKLGADVNAKDNEGKTALFYATSQWKMCYALIQAGADLNARDNDGKTILFNLSGKDDLFTIYRLESYGLNVRATDKRGKRFKYKTAYFRYKDKHNKTNNDLYDAVNSNDISEARKLIWEGADLNSRDRTVKKWNMIHLAVYRNNPEMIELLAKAGVSINGTMECETSPLENAVNNSKYGCVKTLLECGADPQTAINSASRWGTTNIQQLFDIIH